MNLFNFNNVSQPYSRTRSMSRKQSN